MAKTKFDLKTEATKPLLATVGVTDLAVEVVRDFVSETQARLAGVQKDVTARVADAQKNLANPKVLREQAVTVVNARVDALTTDAKARRKAIEARVTELQAEAKAYPAKVQTLVDDNVTVATDTYTDLVKRGESLVGRIRRQESTKATVKSARTTVSKAKTTTTQAKKATTTATTQAKTVAKKTATTAKTSAKPAAKKAAATKSSAKATVTAASNTATAAVAAVTDAADKLGD
jgi:heparin binding hemagglutinin HbhA